MQVADTAGAHVHAEGRAVIPWVADDKELGVCGIDAKAMPPQSLSTLGSVDHSCLD